MSLYIIGIGGTGAKCLEVIANLAAVGLLTEPGRTEQTIHLLYIDADETNGSLERSRNSLTLYQRCYDLFAQNRQSLPWMQTQLRSFGLWSPFSQVTTEKNLGSLFGYNILKQNAPELGSLFDVLFTQAEREATLDVGFRGRPAIGSAVMSQVNLDNPDEEVWRLLIERIRADTGGGLSPKVILYGSIFGGTGAAGLPTIGRLLAKKLSDEKVRDQVPIACIFLLPYFNFTPSSTPAPGEVYARADQFLLNTEAALRYYLTQAKPFNTVYLLGNQSLSQVDFSIGKQTQRNKPHFVELFAGLAARHFLLTPSSDEQTSVVLVNRQRQGRLTWRDLPDANAVQAALANATRFAYVWLSNITPELARAKEIGVNRFQREAPWFIKFFQPNTSGIGRMMSLGGEELADFNAPQEQQAIATISEWSQDYLRWLSELHQCDEEAINLFRADRFARLAEGQTITADELSQLVVGGEADRSKQARDTIPNLKLELDKRDWLSFGKGTVGLARALYFLCGL